jgi:hypothetical protein
MQNVIPERQLRSKHYARNLLGYICPAVATATRLGCQWWFVDGRNPAAIDNGDALLADAVAAYVAVMLRGPEGLTGQNRAAR